MSTQLFHGFFSRSVLTPLNCRFTLSEKVDELGSALQDLEIDLEQQTTEADEAISRWESRSLELEQRVAELEADDGSTSVIRVLQSDIRLKQRLLSFNQDSESESKTVDIIDQPYDAESAPGYILKLKTDLEERNMSLTAWLESLHSERLSVEQHCEDLSDKINSHAFEMGELKEQLEHEKGKQLLEPSSSDVEGRREIISKLENDLAGKQDEISSLRSRCVELAAAAEEARGRPEVALRGSESSAGAVSLQELEVEVAARKKAEIEVATLGQHLKELEEKSRARLEAAVEAERGLTGDQHYDLEKERDYLANRSTSLEQEKDILQLLVVELEDELREADDAAQVHLTNEVSGKATELAAEALRQQVREIRVQAEGSQAAFDGERQARISSEREASRLKGDLAALLGMEDNEETHAEIQRRTIEATEKLHRTERSEIEALKKALSRALDELESMRGAEKDAQTRASKAVLQVSMYENEIIAAKSDFKFMTQTMDDKREAESSRRSSLEHRITSLQNDHIVQRRSHAAEIENLRNELHQASMERDRLFQSLKESEKSRDALLRASSNEKLMEGNSDPLYELAKLRVEKVQLLSAASEESSRAERRLREAVAAVTSSAEADIILEKEVRLAAEKSLDNVKLEIKELRTGFGSRRAETQSQVEASTIALRIELDDLKDRIQSLSEENASLRDRLEFSKNETRSTIERLTEDCRAAKLRVSQLEREGRFEAEVRAEVARLQASESRESDSHSIVVRGNTRESREDTSAVPELYDVIQKQKQAVQEERSMYYGLLAEHDDLLALLAQQDIVRVCFSSALTDAAGPEAVDGVMRKAEAEAIGQYGKYVKLT